MSENAQTNRSGPAEKAQSAAVLEITAGVLEEIHAHGESAYPEEGAGFMIGSLQDGTRRITHLLKLENTREAEARHNRYLLGPQDYLLSEQEADRLGLLVLGVFHSHPDHPNQPSEYDREWAMPWFSYIITSIQNGRAAGSRSWRLTEDRTRFEEEVISVLQDTG